MTILARKALMTASVAALIAGAAQAQDRGVTYTNYGTPGLIEMPSAISADDGQIATTLMLRDGEMRANFTFQITPRLTGTFRYAGIDNYLGDGVEPDPYFDRSFDLRYRITDEGDWMPAIAVGLQDFLGTGMYGGEYVVATKTIGDSFRVTAGLGWGRLGSYNGFDNPLAFLSSDLRNRPAYDLDSTGGQIAFDTFFHGDAAFFGGVEWAPTDRLLVKLEYSSDDGYRDIDGNPLFDRRTPLNIGVNWRPKPGYQIGLSFLHGSEIALTGTLLFNPNDRPFATGLDEAPMPVAVRGADARAALTWDRAAQPEGQVQTEVADALAADGFDVHAIDLSDRAVRIRYTNTTYRAEAQGLGRVARILTNVLPASVETITLEPMQAGIPLSAVTFSRTDLEELENESGGTMAALDRAVITDAGPRTGLDVLPPREAAFDWGISPYMQLTVFDADNPVKLDFGVEARASWTISPNIVLSGAIRQTLTPSDDPGSIRWSDEQPVRRLAGLYSADGNPGIRNLQLAWYDRPGRDLYSRVTVGYLEPMFGGISTELLYMPVDTRWAIGAELNYVAQRDTDMLFGFGNYCSVRNGIDYCENPDDGDSLRDVAEDYRVLTGHLSFYYDFDNGFHGQLDVGRYLAGDWGATLSVDREFENGWRVGAYATLTDVPFEDFGEGSFDKGIRITMPFDFLLGTPTRRQASTTLSSLSRDGGARLNVDGRLYDIVRDGHVPALQDGWGRFWR